MTAWYRFGTATVANGSTTVNFSVGTTLLNQARPGDAIIIAGNTPVEVATVVTNQQLTLTTAWALATVTDGAYAIIPGAAWNDKAQLALDVAEYLSAISGIINSDSTLPLQTGSAVFNVPSNLRLSVGASVRASDTANPTTRYMEGIVTGYSGRQLTVNITAFVGSGSPTSWNINPTGQTGAVGPPGASGVAGPAAWTAVAAWAPSTVYVTGPPASVVTYLGESYVCNTAHTSTGSFDAAKFTKVAAKGEDGAGAVDSVNGQTGVVVLALNQITYGDAVLHSFCGGL